MMFALASLVLAAAATAAPSGVLRSSAEINNCFNSALPGFRDFAVTGTVISISQPYFALEDKTGVVRIDMSKCRQPPELGQIILAQGVFVVPDRASIVPMSEQRGDPYAALTNLIVCGAGTPPLPRKVHLADLDDKDLDLRLVTTEGSAIAAYHDDLSPNHLFLLLKDGETVIPALLQTDDSHAFDRFVDARIRVRGILYRVINGSRKVRGPSLILQSTDNIEILRPSPSNPFDAPPLGPVFYMTPQEVARLGRRTVSGTVVAAWQGCRFLLQTDGGRTMTVVQPRDRPLPLPGHHVIAVGHPETDYFRINLTNGRWREDGKPAKSLSAYPVTARDMVRNVDGAPRLWTACHGYLLRLEGTVRRLSAREDPAPTLLLEDGPFAFPVDVSACPSVLNKLSPGCRIEVTGACVIEINLGFFPTADPRFTGYTIVARTSDDVLVIARPSWWTPARLLIVIGSLFTALVGVGVWNRNLERTVKRRSAALVKERLAATAASLKVDERTRLAAELHDSLSQNLSAVACQVSAAKLTSGDADETKKLLDTAERMLQSSRTELTRCLWDLRGDALEEADFTRAIENTLHALSLKTKIIVRFNVPRVRVDDPTAHAVLCIVRELVSNAARHGAATEIRIAGELHDNTVSFSVRDNGCGFDPAHHVGILDGHFGLDGIQSRVNRLNGTFDLTSTPGIGTKAVVTLTLGHESTGTEFSA